MKTIRSHYSKNICEALKANYELTDEATEIIEALAWRASVCSEPEVEQAAITVLCALRGNWKKPIK